MTRSIALLDLRRFLVTPGFWVIAAFLQFSLAWLLFVYLDRFRALTPSLGDGQMQRGVTDLVATPVLLDATTLLMLVAPLLAMRSFSEERKSGSLVLLLASPVRTAQIVTGKILALQFVLLVPALLTLALVISLSLGTDLDWGKIASGFTGLVLTLTLAASAGAWISALTRHPPVAAALQYALFLMLWLLPRAQGPQQDVAGVLAWLGIGPHLDNLLAGAVTTADLGYYLVFIFGFAGLAWAQLHRLRAGRGS